MSLQTRQQGVILDAASLGDNIDLSPIINTLTHWHTHAITQASDTSARLHNCQAVVTNKVVIDAAIMAQNPQLKLICVAATGTNNIDLEAAKKYGIAVKNAVGYSTESVTQHTLSLILRLAGAASQYQRNLSQWPNSPFFCQNGHPISELSGKTLGIIGFGHTGQAVAKVAEALGMNTIISQRPGSDSCPNNRVSLAQLLQQSDIISLHCPLSTNTQHLISTAELQKMKKSALLINCARGGIINEAALLTALQNHEIAGAALDVLEQEPPASSHPLLNYQQDHPNLILTPHIAWASVSARQRLVKIVAENIKTYLRG